MKLRYNSPLSLKGTFCMLFFLLALGFASCEKESANENEKAYNNMELMFVESKGLPETSIDSVKSFTSKFSSYLKANPTSANSEYYEPTVENISYACSVFGYKLTVVHTGITFNTEWDGEYYVSF